jgi:hypothetical protein
MGSGFPLDAQKDSVTGDETLFNIVAGAFTPVLARHSKSFLGNRNFGFSVLAEVSQQQKNVSQTLLTRIEKLVNQESSSYRIIPRQQRCDEHPRKCMFPVHPAHHGSFMSRPQRHSQPTFWITRAPCPASKEKAMPPRLSSKSKLC